MQARDSLKSLKIWQKNRRLRALEGVRKLRIQARENELAQRREQRQASSPSPPSDQREAPSQSADERITDASLESTSSGLDLASENRKGFRRARETCKQYASLLSVIEWLIDVPEDLHYNWYVIPRPEGKRCLLISQSGSTVSRYKNGSFHKKFSSCLPNGSKDSRTSSRGSQCLLDAVFHSPSNTFYVVDCMMWEDYSLLDCDFEFRRFWISQKFAELSHQRHDEDFAIRMIPMEIAGRDALMRAYSEDMGYAKDGLILIHKESHYIQGQTPLYLQWKDGACSRYPVDTDADGNVLEKQSVVLQLNEDRRCVSTGDNPPLTLGTLPQDFAEQNADLLQPGTLFRFNLGPNGLTLAPDGRPAGANLELVGLSRKRVAGDIVSRIIFQYLTRMNQITFQKLVRSV